MFRVTDREYAALKRVCEAQGGRNLSEFARTELLRSAHSTEVATLHERIESMQQHVSQLEFGFEELIRRL